MRTIAVYPLPTIISINQSSLTPLIPLTKRRVRRAHHCGISITTHHSHKSIESDPIDRYFYLIAYGFVPHRSINPIRRVRRAHHFDVYINNHYRKSIESDPIDSKTHDHNTVTMHGAGAAPYPAC